MAELQQGGEGPREGEEGAQRAGGDDGAPSDAPGEAPAPSPPPPPVLIVDRPPDRPVVVAIDPTTATLQWSAPTITVQASDMRIVECLLNYELNMQQLEGDSSSAQPATIKAERWSVQYAGPATYVQVKGLRPGRRYAVCIAAKPLVTDADVVVQPAAASEVVVVATPATPPWALPAPTLTSRLKRELKFRTEVEETGGRPILEYVMEAFPAPDGWTAPPNHEAFYELYRGGEKTCILKRLQPGTQYSVRAKVANCIGESPWSPVTTATTAATVPLQPDPPAVMEATDSSLVLQWFPPADNGSPIAAYDLEVDDGGGDFVRLYHGPSPSFSVAGLRGGAVYRFRVRAENDAGRSLWSTPTEATTAAAVPAAPSAPARLGCGPHSISIAWQPPEFDGGSPLVGFQLELAPKCSAALRGMPNDWSLAYEGPDAACTIGGLTAGATYKCRVRAVNAAGTGAYSYIASLSTAPDVPDPPAAPVASARQQHMLCIAWKKPDHDGGSPVTSYRLEMSCLGYVEDLDAAARGESSKGKANADPQFEAVYTGGEACAEVRDLSAGFRFKFRVSALNKQGASQWSRISILETAPGMPQAPDAAIVASVASDSLQLVWPPALGQGAPVSVYVVQMGQPACVTPAPRASSEAPTSSSSTDEGAGGGEGGRAEPAEVPAPASAAGDAATNGAKPEPAAEGHSEATTRSPVATTNFKTIYSGPAPSCTVSGLEPFTEYAFRVRAGSAVGSGPWGPVITARTAAAAPAPPVGLAVREELTTSSLLAAHWLPPRLSNGAPVTVFQLDYTLSTRAARAGGPAAPWQTAFSGPQSSCEVSGLPPGRKVLLRVRAANACGWSGFCDAVGATTLPAAPSAPAAPSFTNRMGTSVRARWAAPHEDHGAVVTEFVLEMAPDAGNDFVRVYAGPELACRVQQLQPNSRYRFRVCAVNAVGAGPWSSESSLVTAKAPPPAPRRVEVGVAGDATVSVTWEPSVSAAHQADPTGYEVEAVPTSRGADGNLHKGTVRQACSARTQEVAVGLIAGCAYSVRVRAVGAEGAGHGDWSAASLVALPHLQRAPSESTSSDEPQAAQQRRWKGKGAAMGGEAEAGSSKLARGGRQAPKTVAARAAPKQRAWWHRQLRALGIHPSLFLSLLLCVVTIVVVAPLLLRALGGAATTSL